MAQTTWDIFHLLLSSSAFIPASALILHKFEIFHDFWMKEVGWLRSQYDERGDARDGSGNRGFGFLVEEFARRSRRLPFRNTERGQTMANAILAALHAGDSDAIQLGRSKSNSDFLWVKQIGQRTTIVGMGEVKSSHEAFQKKTVQLHRQEKALAVVAEKLSGNSTHLFFKNKKVELSDDLVKFLVVPFGERDKFTYLPDGWQVTEIEFSHSELVFIAKLVWPYVWPSVSFGDSCVFDLWTLISGKFTAYSQPRLDDILGTSQGVPRWKLGLFVWSTGKLPVLEEDQRMAVELVDRLYWESLEHSLRNNPIDQKYLNDREKRFSSLFSTNQSVVLAFLNLARHLEVRIKEEAKKAGKVRIIKNMLDIDLLEI